MNIKARAIKANRERQQRLAEKVAELRIELSEALKGLEETEIIANALGASEEFSLVEDIESLFNDDEDIESLFNDDEYVEPQTIVDFVVDEAITHQKKVLSASDVMGWISERGYKTRKGTIPNRNCVLMSMHRATSTGHLKKVGRGTFEVVVEQ